jgi:DNA polymerase III subunit epsilon
MYLFFDTETTGLPLKWQALVSDTDNWPRLVQMGCLLYDAQGNLLETYDRIVRPEGFRVPIGSTRIHGISHEKAVNEGISLDLVLEDFQGLMERAEVLVAHNMSFDHAIVGAEYYRKIAKNPLDKKRQFCTMTTPEIINFCKLPSANGRGYKWPSLSDLHWKVFRAGFDNAHNAAADIEATAKCFWELKNRGIIEP